MRRSAPGLILLCLCCAACDGGNVQVSEGGYGSYEPDIAVDGDDVIVAWNDDRHGRDDIYLRILDGDLRPRGPERRLTFGTPFSYEADVAVLDAGLAVAWYDKDEQEHLQVKLGLWDRRGEPLWLKSISDPQVNGRVPGSTPIPRTVLKGLKTPNHSLRLAVSFEDYESVQCS